MLCATPRWDAHASAAPQLPPRMYTRLLVFPLSLLVPFASNAQGNGEASSRLDSVQARGELRVGITPSIPWVMVRDDGGIVGFDVDLAKRLADSLGVRTSWVIASADSLLAGLERGRYDVALGGLVVTPERRDRVGLTRPYSINRVSLLPRADRDTLTSMYKADQEGIVLGIVSGSSAGRVLDVVVRRAEVRRYRGELALFAALRDGEVDAAVVYGEQVAIAQRAFPDLLADRAFSIAMGGEALAYPKSDDTFGDELNRILWALRRSGWIDERRAYWFDPEGLRERTER